MELDILDALGEGWTLTPAGGITGEAYIASTGQSKLFLKRNSSPFLAILSADGIVPKLLWTKRIYSGDVISAQQFIEGDELEPEMMERPEVARLLGKIHDSKELLFMLQQLDQRPIEPDELLRQCRLYFQPEDLENPDLVEHAMVYLEQNLEHVRTDEQVVCHSDLNHNNWLTGADGQLYLNDWDDAIIADRAYDLGMMLYSYVDEAAWPEWFEHYGHPLTSDLKRRMHWYVVAQAVLSLYWYEDMRHPDVDDSYHFLEQLLEYSND
ncbi:phosphotransferase family protein [Exiguobacterium acetylicum]|uniref:phosphotransferase family protein n=1 Tax=Exiguobacterium acetylicum TaxID=41170 RepID=UPI001EE300B0|nr:phosphotransferase family protein [Exiguobacterium acetylicum]UKS55373.1 phosphotransferase family protein [Exiguobacterium acetylicum]